MLLLTSIKNTRGHYIRKKLYIILYNQSPVPIRTFYPTTWLNDRRSRNGRDWPNSNMEPNGNRERYHRYCTIPVEYQQEG